MADPHESLVKMLLDLYSEKTGAPIAFVYKNEIIWQPAKEFCSPYCCEINKWDKNKCEIDHFNRSRLKEGKLTLCHAGLWNFVVPINDKDGNPIGALLTGQRRLKDKDQQSLEVLLSLRNLNDIPEEQYLRFRKSFYETPIIDSFDINYLKTLKTIEERIYEIIITWDIEKRKTLNLAHEFLLPIQSIVANASNLAKKLEQSDGGLKEQANNIKDQVIKLGKYADNMRSSLSGGDEKYNFKMGNILELLDENISVLKWDASRKNVEIKKPELVGNPFTYFPMSYSQLNRAFFNLLHNAVKYSFFSLEDKNRYIETRVRSMKNYCIIEISNYGTGILEDEFEKIFDEGYRGKLSGDRERTGSGIGLTEARKIIGKHGGTITVQSVCMGIDKLNDPYKTTVQVKLPR